MRLLAPLLSGLFLVLSFLIEQNNPPNPSGAVLFEGARLITGDGSAPIENSAFLIENNHISKVGKKGQLEASSGAQRVDLTGKTVVPAIIDAQSHPGYTVIKTSVGWSTHTESADTVEASISPSEVIVAATKTSAEPVKAPQLGMIAPGKSADFVVLDANPLENTKSTRRISSVYVSGKEIDQAAMKKEFTQ